MIEIDTTVLMIIRNIYSVKLLVDQDPLVKKQNKMKYIAMCFSRVILKILWRTVRCIGSSETEPNPTDLNDTFLIILSKSYLKMYSKGQDLHF